MVRVECKFIGIDKEDVVNYWMNPPVDKIKAVKDFRVIERVSLNEMVVYYAISVPMLSDRDFVEHIKIYRDGEDRIFIRDQSIERPDVPPVKGIIRAYTN